MPLNTEGTISRIPAAIYGSESAILDAPEKRTEIMMGVKAKVGNTLTDTLISVFETFNARYPDGIDYRLLGDNVEGVDYLRLEIGGNDFFITCTRNNVNMDSEHISISIYSNTDFYYSQSKKVDITKDGRLTTWYSSEGERSSHVKAVDINDVISSFLIKISSF